ncbi:Respiratory-chain NADH dehydrogenase domain 51 kDa subunit [Spiribacter salinus M19-40]|jgi:NADH:ubiquinone oxidoreductase subunit F (NADH-binding)/NADH:ubiquinone oxidoreductase subunit E|uniref:NADH-quinone oxidoreductase subunit F n=1 Tax=Spiribacter salinus M19-40 TaxID=1260251 RepID=R4VD89_9GAMM|nr:NADH-ubiquinone oxidoreductase-F iron-sulfur binding region domain-containing protein [Spiribacter salinus]AGM40271.1 Respiratory-chain NADH dehydrogenase domain 51 kDa subunit [Spiribacter salinus M19-40]MDR9413999.1 NADH-ubiquinone oxidoreductase-F iron-sulfur binding region domain-containing protein [Spiribacter sp.]MDR9455547.1 NADH-ubiquinone oxidoreductase-F iron-sulfur binding region domain-containing protein [Spiribacter sp.]
MRLLTELASIQAQEGALDDETLRAFAERHHVPLYQLEGLRSFYPVFREVPGARHRVQICRDGPCRLKGETRAQALAAALDERADVDVETVSCIGQCDCAPALAVDDHHHGPLPDVETLTTWLEGSGALPSRPTGLTTPLPTDPYADADAHYGASRHWLTQPPETVIDAIETAGLQGLGGAAFPTARKWRFTRQAEGNPRTVICNADESEPGTFKDRLLLEQAPHLVIEGMLMGAAVIEADHGIIYLRHEYETGRRALETALEAARARGILGPDARGPGLAFDIELFVSPGGYILGEETALLEALEGRRGEPRHKPPFPVTAGLHGGPTLINNVETLAAVSSILAHGPDWWLAQGRGDYAGLKYVSVSGDVAEPQVLCLPWGTTVAEAINQCGGMAEGRSLMAFSPGGASTPFLPAAAAETPMAFETLREAGSGLGTGALFIVGTGRNLAEVVIAQARFFRNESCGKCVPCRTGSTKGVAMATEAARQSGADITPALQQLHQTLMRTSICGLGQVALLPILDALERFPDEPSLQALRGAES